MHILTIHFIFSVVSKCCFLTWVEKVIVRIYRVRQKVRLPVGSAKWKVSSLILYFLLFDTSNLLFKIFILVQSV